MSHEATSWALRQRGLKPATKMVLFYLADRHNPDHGCFPAHKTLAEDAEMSERSVRDHLEILEAAGLIRRDRGHAGGQFKSTRYLLSFEADFQRQILPTANPANGEIASLPTAKSASDRRQNLPTNLVREPCKEPVREPPLVPQADAKRKRAISLPDNWVPSERNVADAQARNFSAEEIQNEADRFRDYHLAKGTTFRDWDAGWRTWLGNARKFGGGGVARQAAPRGHGRGSSLASIVARRRAEREV